MKCLFEDYENQPIELQLICNKYNNEDSLSYIETAKFLKEVNNIGYTFDYGLDSIPYGLRAIGLNLNELDGFEEINN